MNSSICKACNKQFKTTKLLNEHTKRTKLCRDWIEFLNIKRDTFDTRLVERIQTIYENIKPIDNTQFICKSCHKEFSTKSNLNKHIKRTLICQKWDKYHTLQDRDINYNNITSLKDSCYNSITYKDNIEFYEFIPLPSIPMYHIVWNLYLTDKESIIDSYSKYDISNVICIMPEKSYNNYKTNQDVTYINVEYNDHNMSFSDKDINRYDNICKLLLELQDERKNALIVCNNGYQRSLPFICYYLLKYHNNEYPNIESIIDLVLSQIDKENYSKLRNKYIDSMKNLNFLQL